jgi:hypothetical protein
MTLDVSGCAAAEENLSVPEKAVEQPESKQDARLMQMPLRYDG